MCVHTKMYVDYKSNWSIKPTTILMHIVFISKFKSGADSFSLYQSMGKFSDLIGQMACIISVRSFYDVIVSIATAHTQGRVRRMYLVEVFFIWGHLLYCRFTVHDF